MWILLLFLRRRTLVLSSNPNQTRAPQTFCLFIIKTFYTLHGVAFHNLPLAYVLVCVWVCVCVQDIGAVGCLCWGLNASHDQLSPTRNSAAPKPPLPALCCPLVAVSCSCVWLIWLVWLVLYRANYNNFSNVAWHKFVTWRDDRHLPSPRVQSKQHDNLQSTTRTWIHETRRPMGLKKLARQGGIQTGKKRVQR